MAVIVTVPGVVAAVNVAAAIPLDVVAVDVIVPIVALLKVKVTVVPSATLVPALVVTVACILAVPPVVKEDGVAVRAMLAAVAAAPVTPVEPPTTEADVSLLLGAPHAINNRIDISSIVDVNSVLTKDSFFIIFPLHLTKQSNYSTFNVTLPETPAISAVISADPILVANVETVIVATPEVSVA